MKKSMLYLLLLLLLPLKMMAQYGGGNSKGEILSAMNGIQLNGNAVSIYSGGNGRGETQTIINSNQLGGQVLSIYGGGIGRGETQTIINSNQLNGNVLTIYGGGNGRGETVASVNSNQLDGSVLSLYGGGNGRGELTAQINSNQLNGSVLSLYGGGNGRGEVTVAVNTVELNGEMVFLFGGGNGRGETVLQLNTTALFSFDEKGICQGTNTSFTSNIAGTVYQWQVDNGKGFTNISNTGIYSGADTKTIALTAPVSNMYGYQYRCVINGSTYSKTFTLKFATTWTGNESTAWETAGNWSCNALPDANTDVYISGGVPRYPVVNSIQQVRSIHGANGTSVTIGPNYQLTLTGK